MTTSPQQVLNDTIIRTAEALLTERFGGDQHLFGVAQLGGSGSGIVLRAKVEPSPFVQFKSVVIKYIPGADNIEDKVALVREIIGYQFTTSLNEDVRPGPVLLAYDLEKKLIVITDAGDGDTVADLLIDKDPARRIALLRDLGRALGKMHKGTAGKEEQFLILQNRMLQKQPLVKKFHEHRERLVAVGIPFAEKILSSVGISIPAEVHDYATEATRRLMRGQHRAFTPFDLSPDNILVADRKTHFLDYEWAGYRDATFDVACVIAGFPQFLAPREISDEEADVFIDAWVRETGEIWPNVNNRQRLHNRIITALVGWTFSSIALLHFDITVDHIETPSDADYESETFIEELLERSAPWAHELFVNTDSTDEDLRLIRLDLLETYEALYRFARRSDEEAAKSVASFALEMVERLR